VLRDGVTPALLAAIHRELGDVLWHWLMACVEWGAEPDRIAEEMLQRLQDRARRGVVRGSGDER
jgi:phosphoribosyl-ATP pyrophosphohydrolase